MDSSAGFGDELDTAQVAALSKTLENVRYELLPLKNVFEQAALLPEGATVAITASPAKGMEATIEAAVRLAESGHTVVPHLSARLMRDRRELESILTILDRHQITRAFVVAGDAGQPGEFFDSLELIKAMEEIGHGIKSLGVTAYPEGHPFIPDADLHQALIDKGSAAAYMTTQMCFEPDVITTWLTGTRAVGVRLPVYVGIPSVAELSKLLTIAVRIGVGDSRRFASKNKRLIGKLIRPGGYAPDALVLGLAPALTDRQAAILGFHFYTFNRVKSTEEWRHRILAELEAG